jgi:putative Holliday junction resolvase
MARLLALDIGDRRIGVAISDESQILARPLTTIVRASKRQDFESIAKLIAAHGVERLIVGLPRTLRGDEGAQAARVRRYAEALSAAIGVPIAFQDERYTSLEAEERLAASPRRTRDACPERSRRACPQRSRRVDAAAAAIILQDYLNQQISPPPPVSPPLQRKALEKGKGGEGGEG